MMLESGRRLAVAMLSIVGILATVTAVPAQAPTSTPRPTRQAPVVVQPPCLLNKPGTWAIEGALLTPDKHVPTGMITITGERITSVNAVEPGSPKPCTTKIDGIILPGLIDLHNHLEWNIFPRWHPSKAFSNRWEWQASVDYEKKINGPANEILYTYDKDNPLIRCQANLYAEVKALAGGATAAAGSISQDKPSTCIANLVRNLDYDSGLPPLPLRAAPPALCGSSDPITEVAAYNIFPIGKPPLSLLDWDFLLESKSQLEETKAELRDKLANFACHLKSGRLRSLLIHLAEGTDQKSRDEFAAVQNLGLLTSGLVIIHGTALNGSDFAAMKKSGTGLVWSPRSNVELYGKTTNVRAARRAGVDVAIAPDWSPTGSAGMLQELRYAHTNYNDFSAAQLTAMATSVPAKIARIDGRIGRLQAGLYADLLVLRPRRGNPYDAVVNATPADVRLVVIGGRPVYGDADLLQKLLPPDQKLDNLTVCGTAKAIDLSGTVAANSSWEEVTSVLQTKLNMHADMGKLGPFECGTEPDLPGVKNTDPATVKTPDAVTKPPIIRGPGPVEIKPQ